MSIAYFDCFSGCSGDMILGALIDAGLDPALLRGRLESLAVQGFSLRVEKCTKKGLAATQVTVDLDDQAEQPHRHLKHIRQIIDDSQLTPGVKERALDVFQRLAEAEAGVHGTTIEKVHFHEVGAVDAIVDIVGACIGLEALGVDRVVCSPIAVGSGTVVCAHGELPVPAPATARLLQGVPLASCDEVGELTTPTGAALLTTLADSFGPIPSMCITATGYGAGRREGRRRPNVLRLVLGTAAASDDDTGDEIMVLEANLDDTRPETIGYVMDRLFEAGALDVFSTPIGMKKNRPAVLLTVLAEPARVAECEDLLFAETTTFGVRRHLTQRTKLQRTHETVTTRFGPIRVKVGRRSGRKVTAQPEYEDCRAAAERHQVALRTVMDEAALTWQAGQSPPPS